MFQLNHKQSLLLISVCFLFCGSSEADGKLSELCRQALIRARETELIFKQTDWQALSKKQHGLPYGSISELKSDREQFRPVRIIFERVSHKVAGPNLYSSVRIAHKIHGLVEEAQGEEKPWMESPFEASLLEEEFKAEAIADSERRSLDPVELNTLTKELSGLTALMQTVNSHVSSRVLETANKDLKASLTADGPCLSLSPSLCIQPVSGNIDHTQLNSRTFVLIPTSHYLESSEALSRFYDLLKNLERTSVGAKIIAYYPLTSIPRPLILLELPKFEFQVEVNALSNPVKMHPVGAVPVTELNITATFKNLVAMRRKLSRVALKSIHHFSLLINSAGDTICIPTLIEEKLTSTNGSSEDNDPFEAYLAALSEKLWDEVLMLFR